MIPARSLVTVVVSWSPGTEIVPLTWAKPRCVVTATRTPTAMTARATTTAMRRIAPHSSPTVRRRARPIRSSARQRHTAAVGDRGADDRVGEDEVREPDAKVRDDHTTLRTRRARE